MVYSILRKKDGKYYPQTKGVLFGWNPIRRYEDVGLEYRVAREVSFYAKKEAKDFCMENNPDKATVERYYLDLT